MKICNSCGKQFEDSVKFCTNCGSSEFSPVENAENVEPIIPTETVEPVETVPNLSTDLLEQPVPAAPTPEYEPVTEAAVEAPVTEAPIDNANVPNIPGEARSYIIYDRIRKLAASKLSAAFEIVAGLQFVILLIALAVACFMSHDTDSFNSILGGSIILIAPYLFQFIEASVTYSSAKKVNKKLKAVGVVFGAMANIIFTIYAGIAFVLVLAAVIAGSSLISLASNLALSYLHLSGEYAQMLDTVLLASGLRYGLTAVLSIPLAITGLWFLSYILIDVAHTRTVGAIKCESIRKTPVVLPFLAMLIASLVILAAVIVPMVISPVISLVIPVKTTAAAIAIFIIGIALCVLWALCFFVKSILIIRLRACFKK